MKFLEKPNEKEKTKEHLNTLIDDPFHSRSGIDIKKLKGNNHDLYRLRAGVYRFEYFIGDIIWIERAFKRE
ncbi:MAG: type II toxin-antitoxin system RelE/ParE family toxin [Theionarchaea archaeon]|nr:type II toxin-antitoxin system RelE/ParE family toxin [Theionarchaea archaeon]